jgi:pilus assembly protein CpaE
MSFRGWRILVVGRDLAPLALAAFAEAAMETIDPDRGDPLTGLTSPADLVLIDAESAAPAVLQGLIDALAAQPSPPAALLVGQSLPAALVRAIFRLGRSDVLESPFSVSDLVRAAGGLLMDAEVDGPVHSSACWTVTGAVGGAGATTIAVEIAVNLAARLGGKGAGPGNDRRVALVDLNLVDGAAHAYLGAHPAMHLADASASPERIDGALLEAFASKVSSRLDLLSCPRDPNAFFKVAPRAVTKLLEVACQVYAHVVVDLPRQRQPWTLDVISGSDELVVVSELTVPALIAARSMAGELEMDLPGGPRPRIVLNRLASRVFGPAPTLAEAERALQRKADGGITSDWEAAAASANLGGSIGQHRPRSKIVKDIDLLVERLMAEQTGIRAA